jgi:molybdopterin molybdotransferase
MATSILDTLEILSTQLSPVATEMIPIEEALGRIIANDSVASFNLPRFDNSAMDGYAVSLAHQGTTQETHEVLYAGDHPTTRVTPTNAIKIMTGAPTPQGTEAIVPIEDVEVQGSLVTFPTEIKEGNFIRRAGEDIQQGETILTQGTKINAYAIASLASQGISHISVYRKLKIAIFATGDELRPHYESIEPHQLYNSNSPMFVSRCRDLGCETRLITIASDTLSHLEETIQSSLDADMIITSGGVSVGDKDFTKEAFSNLGMDILIDTINIKPGRPTIIGRLGSTTIINLPGNPLASMVNYELFVRAIIRKLSGDACIYHATIKTKIKEDFSIRGGKYAVLLGEFDGTYFTPLKPQMPGMVSPMQRANGLILVTPEVTTLTKDQEVKMIPIDWEFSSKEPQEIFN